jgi:hypothetical protein
MTADKIREAFDKVKSGDIGLASSEVATTRGDEGGISSTTRRKCGPCNDGNHGQCEGEHVCDCDHPSHQGETL